MARALTVTRTAVAPADEASYLEACREEATRVQALGDHYWLFRHGTHPGVFLEFHESASRERLGSADPSVELWDEVQLT